jgi:predicted dehydrogenase
MAAPERSDVLRIGVVGYGEWGPNHVRNFQSFPNVRVAGVADSRRDRLTKACEHHPGIRTFTDYRELIGSGDLNALVVATPTSTHAAIVEDALDAGLHVLCEKPLCSSVADAQRLVARTGNGGPLLMVGHVFLFNAGVLRLRQLVKDNALGTVRYLSCRRTNLGPIRNDVNAVWDLASHDISIANFLLDAMPLDVSAVGQAYLQPPVQDVAFITLRYPNDVLAHIHVSWLDPVKVREITTVGDAKMAVWDDLSSVGPVRIFDKGVVRTRTYSDFGEFQLLAREGDVTIPRVVMEEPLRVQARHFLHAIAGAGDGLSDARFGLGVVKVLAAADASIAGGGVPVRVDVG